MPSLRSDSVASLRSAGGSFLHLVFVKSKSKIKGYDVSLVDTR